MNKTELLTRLARDGEERLLLARTMDKLELAGRRNIPAHTAFLSPQERASVEALINASGRPSHLFYGGFEGAERTICVFLPDWQEPEDWLANGEDCPVSALRCTFPEDAGLTHRDFLGSILGLGLDREKVGDLLVSPGVCDILLLKEIEDFLLLHLESAGRTRLKVSPVPLSALTPPKVEVKRPLCVWMRWRPPRFPCPGPRRRISSPPAGCSSTTGSASNRIGLWPRGT